MATDKERLAVLNKSNPMEALSIHPYHVAQYCMKCGLSSFHNQVRCYRCGHKLEVRAERTMIPSDKQDKWDTLVPTNW